MCMGAPCGRSIREIIGEFKSRTTNEYIKKVYEIIFILQFHSLLLSIFHFFLLGENMELGFL